MKRMKKYASLLLALVMALALAVPAMAQPGDQEAQDRVTVTIDEGLNGHSFAAYQIFKATNQQGDAGALGNITWGDDINSVAFVNALKADATIGEAFEDVDAADAQAVAEVIATFNTDSAEAKIVANLADANKTGNGTALATGQNELEIGYYLIVDTTEDLTGTDAFYNASLLQLTTSIHIRVKGEAPKVEKEVEDVNDSTTDEAVWGSTADHDIGDHVKFKLIATLPSNFTDYESYKLVFHDTLSAGLTYDNNAVVTLGEGDDATSINATVVHENGNLTITIDDVTTIAGATNGSKIYVNYTATLNENALFVNENEVYLEYSNNPNDGGEGDTGTTPPTTVFVFTFTGIVDKVDGNGDPLTGAGFTLYKYDADETAEDKWVVSQTITVDEAGTKFTAKGLDDGWYKLVETTTPDGYNTAADLYFRVTVTHALNADGTEGEVTGFKIEITDETGTKVIQTIETSVETQNPAFNLGTVTTTGDFSTEVVNRSGATLPETGGIGTTIFYVLGGLLSVGAVVLLITKKRMSFDEK